MKLEKRDGGCSTAPNEETSFKGKKPVVVYIMILFIAAFLLMAWSFASHQRSNTEALGQLQTSVTAMQEVQELQDQVISLQKELVAAQETIEKQEREAELREQELEAEIQSYMAIAQLYTLEQLYSAQDFEACRKIIDSLEADGLAVRLSDDLSDSEHELGITISSRDRYHQLKEAVEAHESEQEANS